jgi:nucleoside-diphosphate-sugar epimerase
MRVAIVGDGRLASLLAARASTRGHDVIGAGPALTDSWPADVPFSVFGSCAEMAAALAEQRAEVVVVFGPGRDAPPAVAPVEIVAAVAAIDGARLVYWGSALVYGRPGDVQGRVLLESDPLGAGERSDSAAAAVAADRAVQALVGARETDVHLFRAVELVGAGHSTLLAALGDLAVVPTPYTHRHLQLLDPRDALEVLGRALEGGHPGIYNVSADGLVKVDEACRALRRSAVRLPRSLLRLATQGARWTGKVTSARELLRLTAGTPVLDNARLKTHFGFRPRFTTRQALAAARDEVVEPTV